MKKLNKVVVLMTMMVVIVSCKKDVCDMITDNDFKYWYRYNALDRLEGRICIYYFDNQNKWKVFEIVPNIGFREYDGGDNLIGNKWRLINDSTMEINGFHRKIIMISNDKLVLGKKNGDNDTLCTVPPNMIPQRYYHRW